jgi:hypothetical protein
MKFAANDDVLELIPLRRLFPDSESDWDRGALECEVVAKTGPFCAKFTTVVLSYDLIGLQECLLKLRQCVGDEVEETFRLLEGAVTLKFRLDRQGHIAIDVEVTDDPAFGTRLLFEIGADQTYIGSWLKDIEADIAEFPVPI